MINIIKQEINMEESLKRRLDTLRNLQDKMRKNCIETYNKEYSLDDILNEKMEDKIQIM